jgi:hypothetical protein
MNKKSIVFYIIMNMASIGGTSFYIKTAAALGRGSRK